MNPTTLYPSLNLNLKPGSVPDIDHISNDFGLL